MQPILSLSCHFLYNIVQFCVVMILSPSQSAVLRRRRCRSMSVCVPPSSYSLSHSPSSSSNVAAPPLRKPFASSSLSCAPLSAERDTFAGRLSKALETVLPMHPSTSPQPRARQRRASLPALFSTPVGPQNFRSAV